MWIGYDGDGTSAASPGWSSTHIRWLNPSLAPIVASTLRSGSRSTPYCVRYRVAIASRSLGMPRLAEYRWLRALRAASASFSTAIGGDGMSGLPKPRSTMSRPARRASDFRESMIGKTYGGRPGTGGTPTAGGWGTPSAGPRSERLPRRDASREHRGMPTRLSHLVVDTPDTVAL